MNRGHAGISKTRIGDIDGRHHSIACCGCGPDITCVGRKNLLNRLTMSFASRFLRPRIWKRIFFERLTEPLHLNLLAVAVGMFGSFRQKVSFDLVIRHHVAYGLLKAADLAKSHRITEITAIELGVASGAGLMNMAKIARKVEEATGVKIHLAGFDTGKGMPPARDYRDHPEYYGEGDFPINCERLRSALPQDVELVLGELKDTVPAWMAHTLENRPIGYVVVDVDYYSSTVDALTNTRLSID